MLFIDYQSLVFLDYQRKKAAGSISTRLINPTRKQIRDECISVCKERWSARDQGILRLFFEQQDGPVSYIQAINRLDADKFKPLINYLKGDVKMPEPKNVELLAWLIDFKPRPFDPKQRYEDILPEAKDDRMRKGEEEVEEQEESEEQHESTEQQESGGQRNGPYEEAGKEMDVEEDDELVEKGEDEVEKTGLEEEQRNDGNPKGKENITDNGVVPVKEPKKMFVIPNPKRQIRSAILIMLSIVSIGTCIYLLADHHKPQVMLTGKEGCMYWAGDHYEQVSCNQKFNDTVVVALDSVKLNHFRKITEPDTLTGKSKGSVWYVKIGDSIEFYTSDGYHPIQFQKRLRPITDYILFKYVHHQ